MKRTGNEIVPVPNRGELSTEQRSHFQFQAAAEAIIAAKRSANTRSAYRRDLKRWVVFCFGEGVDPVKPSLVDTTAFRELLGETLAKSSCIRTLAALSGIYRLLMRGRVVASNPFHPAVLAWPASGNLGKTKAVSDEVARKMIAACLKDSNARRGAHDVALLRLLYDTGLRRQSVAVMRREKFRDGCIETIVKGDKEVELELPKTSVAALEKWLEVAPKSPYIFPAIRGRVDRPIHLTTINKILRRRAKAVGTHVHPHMFRAAFATAAYDAQLMEYEIQAALHHADARTTRKYDRNVRGRRVATKIADLRSKDE